jgi:hypothetical protein
MLPQLSDFARYRTLEVVASGTGASIMCLARVQSHSSLLILLSSSF